MAPLAKNGGPQKKSWTAVAVLALFLVGLLAAAAFGDSGGGATPSSGTTDTTAVSSSASTDTGTTDTTPPPTTTDSTPADTTTAPTTTTDTTPTNTTPPATSTPTISSDFGVYGPGAVVTLTGGGWQPGESVHVFVNDDQGKTWSYGADVTADANGSFTHQFQLPTNFVAVYTVTATGTNNDSATTQFQDDAVLITFPVATSYTASTWATGCTPVGFCGTANGGNTGSVRLSVRQGTGNYWTGTGSSFTNSSETFVTTTLTATGGNNFNWSLAFPITNFPANGSYTLHVQGLDAQGQAIKNDEASAIFTISAAQATTLSVATATGTYGTTASLSATLRAGASGVASKTISFSLNGTPAGTATTNASGVATLSASVAGINANTYTGGVTASFAGDSSFQSSNGAGDLTVNAKQISGSFTAGSKTYDGTTAATIASRSLTGVVGTDDVSLSGGNATFADKNVGTAKTVTGTGFSLAGAKAPNYTLSPTTLTTTANITARSLAVTAQGVDKTYDRTTTATANLSDDRVAGDVFTDSFAVAAFADKNVGSNKVVSVSGISISGADATNYTLANTTVSTTANISAKPLTVTAAGVNKQYDGTTAATVTLSDNRISGDVFTDSYASAAFNTKSVGTGKPVTVSGISISGADASNYSMSTTTASTAADITARALHVTATGVSRAYDGTTSATVTLSDDRISGDLFTDSFTSATFVDKHVGTNKPITVSGISIAGADASNYALASASATATANISARSLTVTATGAAKIYDGTTAATVTLGDNRVAGDTFTDSYTAASFADKNAANGKTVAVTGISISGTDAGDYALGNTTATTSANITPAALHVSATGVNKAYDGATAATVTLSDDRVSGDAFTESYTTAVFADKNTGNGKSISVSGISISGVGAANYALANTTASATANITARALTVAAHGVDKVYDGTTLATVNLSDDRVLGDVFTASYGSASFADKNVGSNKSVSVSGISISGPDASNYSLQNTSASTTANISAKPLTVAAAGVNRAYDGTTAATVTLSDNRISGDAVSDSYTSASFADKNVGTGKAVSVNGISISGSDANNYALQNTTDSTTADITARALNVSATGVNKVYDGTTTATVTLSDDRVSGDAVSDAYTSASFGDKNVGSGKPVSVSGISISGTDAGNYALQNTTASTTADVTARALTVSAEGVDKVYDATTLATVNLSDDRISGDVFTDSYGSASFADKNVGTTKPVTVSGISISGTDAGNYDLQSTTASTSASISARALSVLAAGVNKVYDGTTSATVTLSDDRVAGDDVSDSYTSASFADKTVGTGKAVSVSGISIGGADASNYALQSTIAAATADITPRPLAVTAHGENKVYDGTASATVNLSDDRVSGDVFTDSYTSASFADKNVGSGKPISVSGISISGTDAGNYALQNTSASATADISARQLTVTAHGANKTYDGTTGATVTLTDDRVAGDVFDDSYSAASFADKNVGTGKAVSVTGISISGSDADNYALQNATASTSADINARSLTVSATGVDKIYDGTTDAAVTLSDDRVSGDVFTDSYTSASFGDKNVAKGKSISVSGISVTGSDAGNYNLLDTAATATANITPRDLTVSAHGTDKVYDGNTSASVNLSDDRVSGDDVSDHYTSALFADKNVGSNKAVSVSGISISGSDADNYNLTNTSASTTANISARPLTVSAAGVNRVYDGGTVATVTLSDNRVSGDVVNDSYASASFSDKNVASGKPVSVSGIAISGSDAGNYALQNTTASTTADITARPLTVSATGVNKVYDGTASATVNLSDDRVPGDVFTDSYTSASFGDKNVGSDKSVSVSGISISGTDAGNYALQNNTASATANISARQLTVTAHGANKTYDGTTAATVTLTDDRVAGDVFTDSYSAASFADKNVGTGKAVSVSGIAISGSDAGNYALQNATASTTADITARPLTVSATGVNKVYDGTTNATVTLSDNRVSGDAVTDSYTSASFGDKNVANGKPVSVSGISIGGTDAGNYALQNNTASTTANITRRALTVSATGVNRVYDGTTAATVTLSDDRISGDAVSDSYTSAAFGNKNVGTGKAVSVSGISISGADSGNYAPQNTTASTTADITGRPLTVSATGVNKVYDGNTSATVTLSDDRVSGDVLTDAYAAATFGDKNVGNAKAVSVTGISISGADAGNYSLQNATTSTSANITPRPITVKADDKTKPLGSSDPALTYAVTSGSLVSGDGFSGSLSRASGEAIGSYPITQGTLSAGANYAVTFMSGTLKIVYAAGACLGSPGHAILQPINADGTSIFKQGSTVPAKFRVCDSSGNSIGSAGVVTSFKNIQIINGVESTVVNEDVVSTTPDSAFRWSATDQQWIFNINTKSLNANKTYVYLITLNDGTTIQFQFGLK